MRPQRAPCSAIAGTPIPSSPHLRHWEELPSMSRRDDLYHDDEYLAAEDEGLEYLEDTLLEDEEAGDDLEELDGPPVLRITNGKARPSGGARAGFAAGHGWS